MGFTIILTKDKINNLKNGEVIKYTFDIGNHDTVKVFIVSE